MVPLNAVTNQRPSRGAGTQVPTPLLAHGPQDRKQHTLHMQEAPGRDQDSLYVKKTNTFAVISSACSTAQQHSINLSQFHLRRKGQT